jgi:hypothetical protein
MGLFHSDHALVTLACLALMQRLQDVAVHVYEDVPYRHIPGVVQARLCDLAKRGYVANGAELFGGARDPRHQQVKQAAIATYENQLRAFGPDGHTGLVSPERYWQLRDKTAAGAARARRNGHNACSVPSSHR